ncbi:phenolic glucoside malonyltransferase 1-like [Prunus yedoensis var. nudiflora]|uniref:Phenolic glucoside malonyltransferase 1-like n=1 Tax=Prunus yedoensis var. nudiflora TaxID=2094558 RepID=A0A314Z7G2_PRUYE|nr:phenolic glucoside malonyltransferase 1-like [Prunus yedoensis var. nudiflora]
MLTLAGSHRFGVYETDFGWGRPKKVEIVSIDRTRAISFSDPKTDAGVVDVGLVLDKHTVQGFASLFAKGLQNP